MKWARASIYTVLLFTVLFIINSCGGAGHKGDPTPTQTKSSEKKITAFTLTGTGFTITGAISGTTITFTAPAGADVTALIPAISISDKATISPATGAAQDFSKDVSYTVTAEDGSTQVYKVTVTIAKAVTQTLDCGNIPAVLKDLGEGVDYIVKCNIALSGSSTLLTIMPGVTIQFDGAASGITISGGAALKMIGTSAKPIVLEGKTAVAGSWTGIMMDSKNTDNQWEYVTLQHAGGGSNAAGLLISDNAYFLHNSQISINHCTFANNKGYGIWDFDNGYSYSRVAFTSFANNVFKQNSNSPLNITIDDIGKLDATSDYSNNGEQYIELHATRGLHSNVTVQKLNVPYLVVGSIGLHQRMNISPGITFQFYTDAGFNLDAQYEGSGTFIANGTASNPIRFVGFKPGKGVWLGLSLGNNDAEISLNHCVVDGAGSNKPNGSTACIGDTKGAINFYPSCNNWTTKPLAINCTVSNSGGYGIIYKKGMAITFTGNTYSGNTLNNENAF